MNNEFPVINDQKTKQMEILPNTISHAIPNTEELREKDEQRRS